MVATTELHMPIEKQGGWLVGCDNWAPQKKATGLAWPIKVEQTRRLSRQITKQTASKAGVKIIILKEISGLKGNREI